MLSVSVFAACVPSVYFPIKDSKGLRVKCFLSCPARSRVRTEERKVDFAKIPCTGVESQSVHSVDAEEIIQAQKLILRFLFDGVFFYLSCSLVPGCPVECTAITLISVCVWEVCTLRDDVRLWWLLLGSTISILCYHVRNDMLYCMSVSSLLTTGCNCWFISFLVELSETH